MKILSSLLTRVHACGTRENAKSCVFFKTLFEVRGSRLRGDCKGRRLTEVKTQTADSSSRTANSDSPVGHTDAGPDVTPADTVCTAYPSGLEGVHGRKRVELAACPRDSRGADHYIRACVYIYTCNYVRATDDGREINARLERFSSSSSSD